MLFADAHNPSAALAQMEAFGDTWLWTPETEQLYLDLVSVGTQIAPPEPSACTEPTATRPGPPAAID